MAAEIKVTWTEPSLASQIETASKATKQALRAAVNSAAVEAKRAFVKATVTDSAGPGVTAARVRKQTTPIMRASVSKLEAKFVATNTGWGASPKLTAWGGRGTTLDVTTFRSSGGGSANLALARGFVINANGGSVVFIRQGSGKGMGHALTKAAGVKRVYAEAVGSALAYERNVPNQVWQRTAKEALGRNLARVVPLAFLGQSVPDGPADV